MGISTLSSDGPSPVPTKRRRKQWDDFKREQQLALVIMGLNRTARKVMCEARLRFSFPRLGLRVQLRSGDVIFFRGKDLIHSVADWGDGERDFLIYFTHESAWCNVGLGGQCTSNPVHIPRGSTIVKFNVV